MAADITTVYFLSVKKDGDSFYRALINALRYSTDQLAAIHQINTNVTKKCNSRVSSKGVENGHVPCIRKIVGNTMRTLEAAKNTEYIVLKNSIKDLPVQDKKNRNSALSKYYLNGAIEDLASVVIKTRKYAEDVDIYAAKKWLKEHFPRVDLVMSATPENYKTEIPRVLRNAKNNVIFLSEIERYDGMRKLPSHFSWVVLKQGDQVYSVIPPSIFADITPARMKYVENANSIRKLQGGSSTRRKRSLNSTKSQTSVKRVDCIDFIFHQVPSDGNCYYYSLYYLLKSANILSKSGCPEDILQAIQCLRNTAADITSQDNTALEILTTKATLTKYGVQEHLTAFSYALNATVKKELRPLSDEQSIRKYTNTVIRPKVVANMRVAEVPKATVHKERASRGRIPFADQVDVHAIRTWLKKWSIGLVNITETNVNLDTLYKILTVSEEAQGVDYVMFVSTNDKHYNWIQLSVNASQLYTMISKKDMISWLKQSPELSIRHSTNSNSIVAPSTVLSRRAKQRRI